MKIAIGNDHGGVELKNQIIEKLSSKYDFVNCGTDTTDSVDYPDFAIAVGKLVANKKVDFGIVICRSGIGMSIAANKVNGIRCALVDNEKNAYLCHAHNNANMIAMGANDVNIELALKIIDAYVNTTFEERHQKRLDKITNYEHSR